MVIKRVAEAILDNFEAYFCRTLLACFVLLLFAQIVSREVFGHSLAWTEELAVYLFVWFVFFGASYAARMSAHNRVTFHFKWLNKKLTMGLELLSDLIWVGFNAYFVWLSYDFIFNRMNLFWKSQTLGVPMKYIYLVLPIAFSLMTLRVIQAAYQRTRSGNDAQDPESIALEKIIAEGTQENNAPALEKTQTKGSQ